MNKQFFMLLFFSIALIFFAALTVSGSGDQKQEAVAPNALALVDSSKTESLDSDETSPDVIAYYFYTTRRCISCKKIEEYTKEAIENGFADELKKGTLEFHAVNVDEPENKHFIRDYNLYTKSVIICHVGNGIQKEWKNLTEVWKLLRNKNGFFKYVQEEINRYLKEN